MLVAHHVFHGQGFPTTWIISDAINASRRRTREAVGLGTIGDRDRLGRRQHAREAKKIWSRASFIVVGLSEMKSRPTADSVVLFV